MFFDLEPEKAVINDINPSLMSAYRLIGEKPEDLKRRLRLYAAARKQAALFAEDLSEDALRLHRKLLSTPIDQARVEITGFIKKREGGFKKRSQSEWPASGSLWPYVVRSITDKMLRTRRHEDRNGEWSDEDVQAQIETAVHAGLYTYIRDGYQPASELERVAKFLYLREFCYGAMFRFNKDGKFNIPYGGRSYDKKSLTTKINYWFSDEVVSLLQRTEKHTLSFEQLFSRIGLRSDDFIFLDPPYDTEFSDYDQFSFARKQQEDLAEWYAKLPCPALMIIGKTSLTQKLYRDAKRANSDIIIEEYEKVYSYNVRGRNSREITHLAIRNYDI